MSLEWIHEVSAAWDADKQRILGDAGDGVFDRRYRTLEAGTLVPGEWWRVQEDGAIVGYGWMDIVWGDAEILLATAASSRRQGVGQFILDHLEGEAHGHGVNYLYNVVRPTHPDIAGISAWLAKRGFTSSEDGALLRATVGKNARP